jgi:hypothetical protein
MWAQCPAEEGEGYFYFWTGGAADWIDRTMQVTNISTLMLDPWIAEFERPRRVNPGDYGMGCGPRWHGTTEVYRALHCRSKRPRGVSDARIAGEVGHLALPWQSRRGRCVSSARRISRRQQTR